MSAVVVLWKNFTPGLRAVSDRLVRFTWLTCGFWSCQVHLVYMQFLIVLSGSPASRAVSDRLVRFTWFTCSFWSSCQVHHGRVQRTGQSSHRTPAGRGKVSFPEGGMQLAHWQRTLPWPCRKWRGAAVRTLQTCLSVELWAEVKEDKDRRCQS